MAYKHKQLDQKYLWSRDIHQHSHVFVCNCSLMLVYSCLWRAKVSQLRCWRCFHFCSLDGVDPERGSFVLNEFFYVKIAYFAIVCLKDKMRWMTAVEYAKSINSIHENGSLDGGHIKHDSWGPWSHFNAGFLTRWPEYSVTPYGHFDSPFLWPLVLCVISYNSLGQRLFFVCLWTRDRVWSPMFIRLSLGCQTGHFLPSGILPF